MISSICRRSGKILDREAFLERLALEAKTIEEEEPSFQPLNGDLTKWRGFILGTSVYDGGVFRIELNVDRSYPFKPPKARFLTPIWHPNITREGRICLGILGKDWSPSINLVGVIEAIRNLLSFPNPHDPLNRVAAKEMRESPKEFKQKVKEYIKRYATWKHLRGM